MDGKSAKMCQEVLQSLGFVATARQLYDRWCEVKTADFAANNQEEEKVDDKKDKKKGKDDKKDKKDKKDDGKGDELKDELKAGFAKKVEPLVWSFMQGEGAESRFQLRFLG